MVGPMPDLSLSLDLWPWLWLVVALALVVIELTVLSGSLMVLPFGVSAFFASLLAFAGVATWIQWVVFLVGGTVLFLLFWRYQSLVQRGNVLPPGVGAVRLVGMTAVVTRAIDPGNPEVWGQVEVEGDTWGALTDAGRVLPEGTRVRITDVEGTRVKVEPLGDTSEPTAPAPDPEPSSEPPPTDDPERGGTS
jgi:membrane protein implicated in regulation of membrane protease activity